MLLKHYLDLGRNVTDISEELGISRQTVYRWIRAGELERDVTEARYGPRPPVSTKLDSFKPLIDERLAECRRICHIFSRH